MFIRDAPVLLRHFFHNFWAYMQVETIFRLRVVMLFLSWFVYLCAPFDLLPESVLGLVGWVLYNYYYYYFEEKEGVERGKEKKCVRKERTFSGVLLSCRLYAHMHNSVRADFSSYSLICFGIPLLVFLIADCRCSLVDDVLITIMMLAIIAVFFRSLVLRL